MADNARAIENLLYRYAERIDAGDFEGVGQLFAHGRIEAAPGVVIEGADRVRKLYEGTTRRYDDGTPRTRHVMTNAIIDVDDAAGTAAARSYYTVYQQTDDVPLQPIVAGRYHDTFHRVDGDWCFDTRTMFVDLKGNLSHHLLIDL
jgi:3-phenylpropionate/cinnamic acid dioxygenase small subunit